MTDDKAEANLRANMEGSSVVALVLVTMSIIDVLDDAGIVTRARFADILRKRMLSANYDDGIAKGVVEAIESSLRQPGSKINFVLVKGGIPDDGGPSAA